MVIGHGQVRQQRLRGGSLHFRQLSHDAAGPKRAEQVELACAGGLCAPVCKVDDRALSGPFDGRVRGVDEALQPVAQPVVAAGLAPLAVHPLLDDDPLAIVGDDEDTAMADRPQVRAALGSDDPRQQLRGFVAIASEINARVGPLYRVLVTAAGVDRESAELLEQLTQQRQQGQRMFARSLARSRRLRADLRAGDAEDVIHALVSPELYRLLVIDRSWTVGRYESWLVSTLIDQLLPAPNSS